MPHSRVDLRLATLRERIELHYRALFDLNPHPMWVYDSQTLRFLDVNQSAVDTYGYSRDEFLSMTIADIRPADQRSLLAEALRDGYSRHCVWCHLWKDGTAREVEVDSTDFTIEGRPARLVTATDVTERRVMQQAVEEGEARLRFIAEENLRRSESRYRMLFERNLAGVYRSTIDGTLLECNEAFATILGFDSPEEALKSSTTSMYLTPADRDSAIARLSESGRLINFELCLRKQNGDEVWVLENESLIAGVDGAPATMEGTLIDITDRKKAEKVIEHQSYYDALTDLPNRILFHDRLNLAVAHALRSSRTLAVMFVDLDHFKLINDTLGHSVGDQLLQLVASRMSSVLRPDDTVARSGGDEFSLLLPDLRNEDDSARLAQKIRRTIAEPFHIAGRELYVTASIGIGLFPSDGDDAEGLIKAADLALFRAKDLGRDNYQFYTPVAQVRAQERLALENSLRRALDRQELEIHYQPQLDLASTEIIGVEALLRWRHPSRGLIYPGDFIHLAEEIGMILPIGEWVLRSACQQALSWSNRSGDGLRLAVNLSARQFQQPGLTSMVERILMQTGFPAERLEIEITESVAMQNIDLTIEILRTFRERGIGVSIDDFGTGYSSLSYLKLLPIDTLKIDQSFIREIATARRDARIVRAVIEMAHSLGLRVIAEGVETEDQLATLQSLECDEIQGFLFSRPITACDLEALLESAVEADLTNPC